MSGSISTPTLVRYIRVPDPNFTKPSPLPILHPTLPLSVNSRVQQVGEWRVPNFDDVLVLCTNSIDAQEIGED